MKVLKFGGSSIANLEGILRVGNIIKSHKDKVLVVVSAFSGITDKLIAAAKMAESGNADFRDTLSEIRHAHISVVRNLSITQEQRNILSHKIDTLLLQLENICEGIFLLHVLPAKTYCEVLSFGERLSSEILAASIPEAETANALNFIKTRFSEGSTIVDSALTTDCIRSHFGQYSTESGIAIVPGFIASDAVSGETTLLGRGGSDYSASLIAAALNAECLEIWTDVDGFMTADPRMINTAYVIEQMSYAEAMELSNFGAKVIYPPTLYPVCTQGIPIIIKNSFNPAAPGTTINAHTSQDGKTIKGISSIDDISLITLSGTSMVGVVGVDARIFSALTREHISAFLVSQSASETGISIGVSKSDAALACEVLGKAFAQEISTGAIFPIKREDGLAAVAIVGENMKDHPGVAGKLFSTLGRSGISVIACAQGSKQINISFIIDRAQLRKALNVIHDSFFLSEFQELNIFLCGVGTVGGQLLEQIASQREKLMRERNLKINIVGIARSTKAIFDRNGIELVGFREKLESGVDINPQKLKEEIIKMNIFNSVFVDCTANEHIAALYEEFFFNGISVVTANKIAASSDYPNYRRLKDAARKSNVKFLFETNVGAGLPIINTINDLCNSGDRILKMEAVLSGTLNFIFNTISKDIPFSQTVKMAQEQGFSEPDPRIDLSGKDVIRKLVILSREAGYELNQEDVEAQLFIPQEFFDCSMEEFWEKLPSLDADFERRRAELEAKNMRWRFVAKMEEGKYSVSLRAVDNLHSFYVLDGSNNIILLTTERYNKHPMLIQGYGAGASVTAAGVFADIMSIANI